MRNIWQVQAAAGGTWYTGDIQKKQLEGDKIVIHAVFPALTSLATTVTSLRVLDIDGQVAATKTENIKKAVGQGFLIKLELPIIEQEV